MDCTQKNAAHRSPRVTGVTRWTLEAGYKIMSPAASFTGAFLIDDRMFVGVVKDELMVRVGKEHHDEWVRKPGARTMDFTRRPMIGYIFVEPSGLASDRVLAQWIEAGLSFTRTVPAKKTASKARPKPAKSRRA